MSPTATGDPPPQRGRPQGKSRGAPKRLSATELSRLDSARRKQERERRSKERLEKETHEKQSPQRQQTEREKKATEPRDSSKKRAKPSYYLHQHSTRTMEFQAFLIKQGVTRHSTERRINQILSTLTFASRFRNFIRSRGVLQADFQDAMDFLRNNDKLDVIALHGKTFSQLITEAAELRNITLDEDESTAQPTTDDANPNPSPGDQTGQPSGINQPEEVTPETTETPDPNTGNPAPAGNEAEPEVQRPSSPTPSLTSGVIWKTSKDEAFQDYLTHEGYIPYSIFSTKHFGATSTPEAIQSAMAQIQERFDATATPINHQLVRYLTGQELQNSIHADRQVAARQTNSKPITPDTIHQTARLQRDMIRGAGAATRLRRSQRINGAIRHHAQRAYFESILYPFNQQAPAVEDH
jgi:hypothetical protein